MKGRVRFGTPEHFSLIERTLVAAGERNLSQTNALIRVTEAKTLEDAKTLAAAALTEFA